MSFDGYIFVMKFREKLVELTRGRVRKDVAADAGIAPGILNNYINRGSEPMASQALKLARALQVPFDWLVDDDSAMPPPSMTDSLANINDNALMAEVTKRWMRALKELQSAYERVAVYDWAAARKVLQNWDGADDPLPPDVQEIENVVRDLMTRVYIAEHWFDPRRISPVSARRLEADLAAAKAAAQSALATCPEVAKLDPRGILIEISSPAQKSQKAK